MSDFPQCKIRRAWWVLLYVGQAHPDSHLGLDVKHIKTITSRSSDYKHTTGLPHWHVLMYTLINMDTNVSLCTDDDDEDLMSHRNQVLHLSHQGIFEIWPTFLPRWLGIYMSEPQRPNPEESNYVLQSALQELILNSWLQLFPTYWIWYMQEGRQHY